MADQLEIIIYITILNPRLPVSLVGRIAIGSASSDWPDFVTQAT